MATPNFVIIQPDRNTSGIQRLQLWPLTNNWWEISGHLPERFIIIAPRGPRWTCSFVALMHEALTEPSSSPPVSMATAAITLRCHAGFCV